MLYVKLIYMYYVGKRNHQRNFNFKAFQDELSQMLKGFFFSSILTSMARQPSTTERAWCAQRWAI